MSGFDLTIFSISESERAIPVGAFGFAITIFLPKCNRDSLSQMLYFKILKNTQVYVGKCIPIILNPSLLKSLKQLFGINFITSAKKDIDSILNN